MAALCLNASLEMLWPLCCCCTHRLQWELCCCLHERSLQAAMTLTACHVLQNSPQFIVQRVEVWTTRGPILSAKEGHNIPPQPLLSHLGLVDRSWVLLEDPFLTTEEGCAKIFHNSLKHIVLIRFSTPFLQKWRGVTPWWDTPNKPWYRKGDGLSAPLECFSSLHGTFEHKSCSSGDCVKIFSSMKRMFSCPFSACHWRRCSALVHWISFKAGVRRCPFKCPWALMCLSFLMRRDIGWVSMFSSWGMIFCFRSSFRQICSCTVLIGASALTLLRCTDQAPSSTLQSFL